jgi:hypothetical protein
MAVWRVRPFFLPHMVNISIQPETKPGKPAWKKTIGTLNKYFKILLG